MDGTLVDTEPSWMRAEAALVESFGGTWTHEDGMQLVGSGLWDSARILQSRGVAMEANEIVSWLTDRVHREIQARGYAEDQEVFNTIRPQVIKALQDAATNGTRDTHGFAQVIRRTVGRWVNTQHRRRPMIIPVVIEA
jgi:beta-phosphoglucomutase-like phosphatase (HAD superfamily)